MRIKEVRKESLAERLRERRSEIEQVAMTRVFSVSDPTEGSDPEYVNGLRAAVSAALQYGIEALERSEDRPAPIPTALRSQARLAARNGVELDTVLRRYLAGHALLDDFLVEESERGGLPEGASLKRLLRVQAAALDRLLEAVSDEYAREARARPGSPAQRRARRIERLLAGEPLDTSELSYDFEGHHVAVVATGPGAPEALRGLARGLDRNLLLVLRDEGPAWAWLGGRRALEFEEIEQAVARRWPPEVYLAIGEPGQGLAGWRLTHRQARAALSVALRGQEKVVRYAEVALLASVIRDELLVSSLRRIYIEPLAATASGGEELRETLRTHIATGGNTSSSAAALHVDRRTVTRRIRMIEETLGHSLAARAADLDVALRLWDFDDREGTKWDSASHHHPQSDQAP